MTMPLDWSSDTETFDGLQTVSVLPPGASESFSAEALKRPLTLREIEVSGGSLFLGDVRWHFCAPDLLAMPTVGTQFTESDGRAWTVIAVDSAVFGGRCTCTARLVEAP